MSDRLNYQQSITVFQFEGETYETRWHNGDRIVLVAIETFEQSVVFLIFIFVFLFLTLY